MPKEQSWFLARSSNDVVRSAYMRSKRLLHDHAPLQEILAGLVRAAEKIAGPDTVASILVLDEDGLLRNGASPKLPADYLAAIDRLKPQADLGTCASAAATGAVVITPSFLADDKWAELRHLPLALGFAGAWSMPIKSATRRVLGTFGTYYRTVREPNARELSAVGTLAACAALALEANAA